MGAWRRSGVALAGAFLLGTAVGALGLMTLHYGSAGRAHAQTAPGMAACSNATLSGTYGALASGFTLTASDGTALAAPLPLVALNLLVADGAGNITRTGSNNRGGVVRPNPGTLSYTVNPDCTFTATITGAPPGAAGSISGALVDGGAKAFVISTDPAGVVAVTWERQ